MVSLATSDARVAALSLTLILTSSQSPTFPSTSAWHPLAPRTLTHSDVSEEQIANVFSEVGPVSNVEYVGRVGSTDM